MGASFTRGRIEGTREKGEPKLIPADVMTSMVINDAHVYFPIIHFKHVLFKRTTMSFQSEALVLTRQ